MDGVFDGGGRSIRAGSLSSLHRQPSGSFSNSSATTATTTNTTKTTTPFNNSFQLYKDLDKFTKYFIIKSVQVIVQSRISDSKKVKTECKPNGNDWFNLNIPDVPEITEKTKAALDQGGFSVRSNWRFCCEISLRTSDGGRIALEYWTLSNRSLPRPISGALNQSHPGPLGSTNQTSATNTTKVHTIYNRMSLMIKTLTTTAYTVPTYRLISKASQADSCVVCYRVYSMDPTDEINDLPSPEEKDHFNPIADIGSVKTEVNELDVSLAYRKDSAATSSPRNLRPDGDCIAAAKQLLAGRERATQQVRPGTDNDSQAPKDDEDEIRRLLDTPIIPPFATPRTEPYTEPELQIMPSIFEGLMKNIVKWDPTIEPEPIIVPNSREEPIKEPPITKPPNPLDDSFVWVPLNPPFASEEQKDLNSLFHGPAPSFSGFNALKDLDDLTTQFAMIEAEVDELDEFVNEVCASEEDEEGEEEDIGRR